MDTRERLTFRIDSYTPDTLPMARLAEYLAHLADLYGNEERVHFEKLKKGSAILQVVVEEPAFPKVFQRLQGVKGGAPDPDAQKAFKAIDRLLRSDGAIGSISREKGGKVLEFPGRKLPEPEIATVLQPTTIDGVVIKIGGKDETIPVLMRDQEGKIFNCQIRGSGRAKELAQHYLGDPLRVHGVGKWVRYNDGTWQLEALNIQTYEVIDREPLDSVLTELRAAKGNGWSVAKNPIEDWKKLRGLK